MLELALYLALTLFVESFGHLLAHELDGQTILKISRHTPLNAAGRSGGGAPANSNCMKVVEAIEKYQRRDFGHDFAGGEARAAIKAALLACWFGLS